MIKIGYKVVSPNYRSLIVVAGSVIYKTTEVVRHHPGCGPLTVFVSLDAARHFMKVMMPPLRVFRCAYIPSQYKSVWVRAWDDHNWRRRITLKKLMLDNKDCLLPGSVDLAEEVILMDEFYDT